MKKWIIPCCLICVFLFLTALFLTPDFTYRCTEELLACIEDTSGMGFFVKIVTTLKCVYHNVMCVLGGLFV